MKSFTFSLILLSLMSFNSEAQTNTLVGKITNVKPFFGDEYALTIGKTTLILILDRKDESGKSFEINNEYKDLLVQNKGKNNYILNPKYAHKSLNISYYINGKGWKCVKNIKPASK